MLPLSEVNSQIILNDVTTMTFAAGTVNPSATVAIVRSSLAAYCIAYLVPAKKCSIAAGSL